MNWIKNIWDLLKNKNNRKALKWIVALVLGILSYFGLSHNTDKRFNNSDLVESGGNVINMNDNKITNNQSFHDNNGVINDYSNSFPSDSKQ